jgi:cell division protein FtsQ
MRRRSWRLGRAVPPLAAALAGALLFVGLTDGGRAARQVRPLLAELDRMAETMGLRIEQVSLRGHRFTSDRAIFDALQIEAGGSALGFDSEAARRRIEALPWIKSATIERRLPSGLDVRVTERQPFARWLEGSRTALIDATGRLLAHVMPGAADHLPQVAGADAPRHAAALLATLAAHPSLAGRVRLAERIGGRRWRLHLDQQIVVELPAEQFGQALGQLDWLHQAAGILDRKSSLIDLRLSDRMAVRHLASPDSGLPGPGRHKSSNGA